MANSNDFLKKIKYKLGFIPDQMYLQMYYFAKYRRFINLKKPKTFNEKLQWLKLYDRNPLYTRLVDKVEVKRYVDDIIGDEYIIPTLGIWDEPDEINFDELPNQFVLKCNHDSGEIFICKDKMTFDKANTIKKLKQLLKNDYYLIGREWPYKNVKRKILAEKYMVNESGMEIENCNILNFNEKTKIIQISYEQFIQNKRNIYADDWKYIEEVITFFVGKAKIVEKSKQLSEIVGFVELLSKKLDVIRTEFCSIEEKVYFCEIIFGNENGTEDCVLRSFEEQLEKIIKLPSKGLLTRIKGYDIVILLRGGNGREELSDYKFMCFNGIVKCIFTCTERYSVTGLKVTFFDANWNVLPFERAFPKSSTKVEKPANFFKMIELAEILSKGIPFVRVDFYESNGKIYFGELTFYPGCGFEKFNPSEWDYKLGEWIKLPERVGK